MEDEIKHIKKRLDYAKRQKETFQNILNDYTLDIEMYEKELAELTN